MVFVRLPSQGQTHRLANANLALRPRHNHPDLWLRVEYAQFAVGVDDVNTSSLGAVSHIVGIVAKGQVLEEPIVFAVENVADPSGPVADEDTVEIGGIIDSADLCLPRHLCKQLPCGNGVGERDGFTN